MAYDPNVYEPPRRPYYSQQQAPMQNGYGGAYQEQYNNYDQQYHDPGYSQGQYDGYAQDMRSARQQQAPQYHDSRQDHRPPQNGYAQPEQRQERQYDPRYRQRPEQGRQQASGQDPRQQRTHQSPPAPQPQERNRPNPSNARTYTPGAQGPTQPQQAPVTTRQQRPRPPNPADNQPTTAPQPAKKPELPKMSMQEWKAKEKARMHAEALSPEMLAQDNAFPVFPTYQNKSRPSTANGSHDTEGRQSTDRGSGDRPSMLRGISHDSRDTVPAQQQTMHRPNVDHQPFSFEPPSNQSGMNKTSSPPPQQRPQIQRNNSDMAPMPVEHSFPAAQPRPMLPRGPPIQRIDTHQMQQPPRPGFMDHQPLSPAVVPPRPSSAQGSHPQSAHPLVSPTSAYSQQTPYDQRQGQVSYQQAPAMVNGAGSRSRSDPRVRPPVTANPMSRDQEIEADMPDFDSAAPGGTSLLHKRSQARRPDPSPVVELPATTNRPTYQHVSSDPAMPLQQQRFYGQHHDQSTMSLPTQMTAKRDVGGITNGFVFEMPANAGPQPQYEEHYQHTDDQGRFHAQPQEQPFQPPYAREQVPRRSMDDARQMPYRQGPPNPQRPPQNGRPPRGPPPPQSRPPASRDISSQTAYSNFMPERGGSAPPRQAIQAPPGPGPVGVPLTQQRSAPDQPQQMHRHSDPDALPHHPAPVRAGLIQGGLGSAPGGKPPPVRNYNGQPSAHQRQVSIDQNGKAITAAELDRLRAAVIAKPDNHKQSLLLAKKLVEAGATLALEGGRADARTVAKNRERYIMDAYKIVKKLVGSGYPDAQFYLADCYGSGGLGLEMDPREAFKLYQAAAKAGHGEAAYRTAMCCELGAEDGGGTSRDYAKAVQWYRRAAALGDPAGMFKVGVVLLKGLLGQQRNVGEAVNWLKRSIQTGDPENPHALFELGLLYESANTNPEVRNKVIADDPYALELFQRAAKLGHKSAQFRLGQAYEYGQLALTIDNRASISWYSKAAAQGEHQAELALSGWYLTGAEGILEHSDTEAYLWARKAASSEPPLAKAMFAMGYFTETGIGCPISIEEAKKWYGRAASYNFPKARERLEELRRNPQKAQRQRDGKLTRNQKKDESECGIM